MYRLELEEKVRFLTNIKYLKVNQCGKYGKDFIVVLDISENGVWIYNFDTKEYINLKGSPIKSRDIEIGDLEKPVCVYGDFDKVCYSLSKQLILQGYAGIDPWFYRLSQIKRVRNNLNL